MIFDTHMHIYDKVYANNQKDVIDRALNNNVVKMIAVGYDYTSSIEAIKLANKYDFIYASIGVHPSEVLKEKDETLSWIYDLAKNNKVVAIGEIGLDYYWDKSFIEKQKEFFIKQIYIANDLNLPIIIHSRDALNDTYEICKENQINRKSILHCYSGSLEYTKNFIDLNYVFGIGGVVTFKNSKEIKRVVENLDLKYFVTETDSPYLTPSPYRGTTNEPGYTKLVLDEIAKIKNMDISKTEDILYKNALNIFNIKE